MSRSIFNFYFFVCCNFVCFSLNNYILVIYFLLSITCTFLFYMSPDQTPNSSFATHACILTRMASTTGSHRRFTRHTTLPYPSTHLDRTSRPSTRVNAIASVDNLSPATLSARNHLTSELLRTLSRVAASKPTSWLSVRLHILFHLVIA